ncbi:MAG TPA: glutathione S-transferase family protein [Gaiellaceae bacterium]|nr:glutathione S-transferase family protein [Gaiellaceae bacterium]
MRLYDYVASANCYEARLLLAQLGCDYERVPIDIFSGDTLTDDFAAINPTRSTPVLETDDGRLLQESNAILWYLADGSEYLPDDPFERAHVLKWLILEQSDVMYGIGGLRFRLLTGRWTPDEPAAVQRRELGLDTLGMLETHLQDASFFVGDRYSIADISLYAYTHTAPDAGFELDDYPAVTGVAAPRRAAAGIHERPRAVSRERAGRRRLVGLRLRLPAEGASAEALNPVGSPPNFRAPPHRTARSWSGSRCYHWRSDCSSEFCTPSVQS